MSVQAMSWAMDEAPTKDKAERIVLIYMADVADKYGRNSFQSAATIAKRSRYGITAVRTAIKGLKAKGLIREGDQRRIGWMPNGQRPVVYDLDLDVTWDTVEAQEPTTVEPETTKNDTPPESGGVSKPAVGRTRKTTPPESGPLQKSDPSRKPVLTPPESGPKPNKNRYITPPPTEVSPTRGETHPKTKNPKRHELPTDWTPSPEARQLARQLGVNLNRSEASFRLWALENHRRLRDWDARFLRWIHGDAKPAATPDQQQKPTPVPARHQNSEHKHTAGCEHVSDLIRPIEHRFSTDRVGGRFGSSPRSQARQLAADMLNEGRDPVEIRGVLTGRLAPDELMQIA
ncbi:helix-turn-helix domain-containing protein [Bifidobacterium vansinderenii]|uniref:DNA-binding helix-turn-helix protein n=1 Tax=Bifidobacterium vansinderenii TaxID=1984871 RepID=A0A229W192_9BIFI|nr:helix-turn-helix domain-containing protein [Bifidobacterium vansinderenii]OXN01631.1 DNA-binding helix-turn-helix protein [Bifidobacterium vansinderenii]